MVYKLLFNRIIFTLTILLLLQSCKKKEEAPEVVIAATKVALATNLPTVAYTNREITLNAFIDAAAGLDSIEVFKGSELLKQSIKVFTGNTTSDNYEFKYTANAADLTKKELVFYIVAYDKAKRAALASHSLKVETAPVNINLEIPGTAPTTIYLNESADFEIAVVSEYPLKSIHTSKNGAIVPELTQDTFTDPLKTSYRLNYTYKASDADQLLSFVVTAKDSEDKEKTITYQLLVNSFAKPVPVKSFSVQMGGQNNTQFGHFLNSTAGTAHLRGGAAAISANLDLIFWISASTGINIASPTVSNAASAVYTVANSGATDALQNWPVRNDTRLGRVTSKVTPAKFASIANDNEIVALYTGLATTAINVTALVENDVFVFKTAAGKHGLIILKGPIPARTEPAGNLYFEVKIQQ